MHMFQKLTGANNSLQRLILDFLHSFTLSISGVRGCAVDWWLFAGSGAILKILQRLVLSTLTIL